MDNDSHSCLLDFDTNYWNLVELFTEQTDVSAWPEPRGAPVAATARPQGSCSHAPEHFRAKFEAMEKAFREEFLSTIHGPADDQPTQVIHCSK